MTTSAAQEAAPRSAEGQPTFLSVRQQASQRLRIAIFDGELAPGARLTEREICERMGVSRTIAREVVRELEVERLIESNRRHGFIVANMSRREILDLYDMRILLEARACELCASAMTPERARRLDLCIEAIEQAAASGIREDQRTSNASFYLEIVDGAGNLVLGQILRALHGRVSYLRSRSMARPGRPAQSLAELKAILAALKAGNGAEAARLNTAHILTARANAMQAATGPDLAST